MSAGGAESGCERRIFVPFAIPDCPRTSGRDTAALAARISSPSHALSRRRASRRRESARPRAPVHLRARACSRRRRHRLVRTLLVDLDPLPAFLCVHALAPSLPSMGDSLKGESMTGAAGRFVCVGDRRDRAHARQHRGRARSEGGATQGGMGQGVRADRPEAASARGGRLCASSHRSPS